MEAELHKQIQDESQEVNGQMGQMQGTRGKEEENQEEIVEDNGGQEVLNDKIVTIDQVDNVEFEKSAKVDVNLAEIRNALRKDGTALDTETQSMRFVYEGMSDRSNLKDAKSKIQGEGAPGSPSGSPKLKKENQENAPENGEMAEAQSQHKPDDLVPVKHEIEPIPDDEHISPRQ